MYRPVLVTPPAITPISLAELKAWTDMPLAATDRDGSLAMTLSAATAHFDGWTGILGRCLCQQVWRQDFDRFARCLRLPLSPVILRDADDAPLTAVKYVDADGIEQTIADSNFQVLSDELGPYVLFNDTYAFPTIRTQRPSISVTYAAGDLDTPAVNAIMADPDHDPPIEEAAAVPAQSNVPAPIKQAIALLARHWFDNPTAVVVGVSAQTMPKAVDSLVAPYRRIRF